MVVSSWVCVASPIISNLKFMLCQWPLSLSVPCEADLETEPPVDEAELLEMMGMQQDRTYNELRVHSSSTRHVKSSSCIV